ncbi:MAG: flagellar motor switch protein FliM [Oscillospiraceae bacterium]|nr:flagellar motor switch protein FliM [Oscillospiraceae bacterium]
MPEILSQNQIDDLLNELMGESSEKEIDTGDKNIKPYNFKNPKKLSRDQQKVLTGIHEIFARHLASYFAGLTRNYCEISVASVEEHPYYEYNNALPDIMMTGIIDINILKGSMLLDMSNSITFALVERMLGGNIEEREIPERDFTEIEYSLIERIFKKTTTFVEEAWAHIPGVSASVRQIETNTRFIKSIAMDEVVAVIVFDVKINTVKGTITCCIPCLNIGSILDSYNSDQIEKHDEDAETLKQNKDAILDKLNESVINVCGILGTATITMKETLDLQPGDVLKLDQHIDSPVLLTVNGKKWFYGQPGIARNQIAVKIKKNYCKENPFRD